jgi:hypothetical protein
MQYQLAKGLLLEAGYVGNRGLQLSRSFRSGPSARPPGSPS